MAKIKIVQHPEYTSKYPAIDGITKEKRGSGRIYYPAEKAVRPDIEAVLEMDEAQFNNWYIPKKDTTERLLEHYEIFASIPNLAYGGEKPLKMNAITAVDLQIKAFKEGLEYLEIIKKVREESRK